MNSIYFRNEFIINTHFYFQGYETYKVTEKSSTTKTSNYLTSADNVRASPSFSSPRLLSSPADDITPAIDHSSNIRVSKDKQSASRRDSWDAINKTKHLLSHNSLESLANMTEKQLNTDLTYSRSSNERDSETERNTRYNKFLLNEKQRSESRSDDADKYKLYS